MKVVVTGFQPFGKETMNPSFEAVRLLPDEIKGAQIVKKEIPVVFRKGGQTVQEIVRAEKPDIVILVGQAGGKIEILAQLIDRGDVDDAVADIQHIGNAGRNELRLAGGDGKLNVRLGILASGIKRNKVILGDAAFLKLGNDSERGIFIIVYQIDTFVRRNLNDFIQEHMVENTVAGELQNGGAKGKRKGFHGADGWKKDALVSPEERGVCGLLS